MDRAGQRPLCVSTRIVRTDDNRPFLTADLHDNSVWAFLTALLVLWSASAEVGARSTSPESLSRLTKCGLGWFCSRVREGTGEEAVPAEDMAETNSAPGNQPHVEKDVLAAGRATCYKARDAFFNCVEADSGHTTPTEVASVGLLYPLQCKPARAIYEENCRSTWVKHFDRQYSAKKRVRRLLDTGDPGRGPITLPSNKVGLQPGE